MGWSLSANVLIGFVCIIVYQSSGAIYDLARDHNKAERLLGMVAYITISEAILLAVCASMQLMVFDDRWHTGTVLLWWGTVAPIWLWGTLAAYVRRETARFRGTSRKAAKDDS